MFTLDFTGLAARTSSVLLLGAHCDDIEIGCGATVLRLLEANPQIEVTWVVLSSDAERAMEAKASADAFLASAERRDVRVESFRERYFPFVGAEIKEYFDDLGRTLDPGIVFTHRAEDMHQDHRLLCELARHTFRNSLLLEYEIPKFEGDLGQPNFFVQVDERLCEEKIRYLTKFFPSQRDKHWFSEDTFWSLMRIRGLESKAPSGHAEAFHCRKLVAG
jgi:LmbE family N-acetylglucosaminyl deacetylase